MTTTKVQIPYTQAQEIQNEVGKVVSTLEKLKIGEKKQSLTNQQITKAQGILNNLATSLWQARSKKPGSTEKKGIKKLRGELTDLGLSKKDAESIFNHIDAVITDLIPSSKVAPETETETKTETAEAPEAEPKAQAQAEPAQNQIPDQLSTLLFDLVSSRDPAQIENAVLLVKRLQKVTQSDTASPPESITQEPIAEKLSALADLKDPAELQSAIEGLNDETLLALKKAVGDKGLNQNIHLLKALLEHGPVVNSYAQVDSRYQDNVDKMLSRLTPAESTDPKTYGETLGNFKGAIHTALEDFRKTCNAVADLHPNIAFNQIKNAERKLTQALDNISKNYNQKILKPDLEIIQKAFSEAKETTKQDSSARNLLETWTKKLFTAEGAVAATMFVPFIANILAGTLGEVPLIGELVKSAASFTSSIASSAQGLIQMINTVNQTKTAKAVARLQDNTVTLASKEQTIKTSPQASLAVPA